MRGLEEAAVFPREAKERGSGAVLASRATSATPALRFATWETGPLLERGCRPRAGAAASPAGKRARRGGGAAWGGGAWRLSPDFTFADCVSAPASSQGTSDTVPDAGIDEDV